MSLNGNLGNGFNGEDQCFVRHIRRFIGETVLVFTTCGGAAGSGFSGVLMEVNCDFIRLVNQQSTPPTCPISNICDNDDDDYFCNGREGNGREGNGNMCESNRNHRNSRSVGSICDIPIDRIAAFCHNAV